MADSIPNTKLALTPDKAKTFAFHKGEIALLPTGATAPAGVLKLLVEELKFSVKPTFIKVKGPVESGTTRYITTTRSILQSVERSIKCTSRQPKDGAIMQAFNNGSISAVFKIWATDYEDPADKSSYLSNEFAGTISLDGELGGSSGGTDGETVGLVIEPSGTVTLTADATTTV